MILKVLVLVLFRQPLSRRIEPLLPFPAAANTIFAIAILNGIGHAHSSSLFDLCHYVQHVFAAKVTAQVHKRLGACSWGRLVPCMTSFIHPSANSVSKSITCCKR
jgi:hypothetical protein